MKYSLINVDNRDNGRVSGNWIQDFTGSFDEALEWARATERANSNRIEVAVVEKLNSTTPCYSYYKNLVEIKPELVSKFWNMVNSAVSHSDIAKAEAAIKESNINNTDYDELMMSLSFISRELYHSK